MKKSGYKVICDCGREMEQRDTTEGEFCKWDRSTVYMCHPCLHIVTLGWVAPMSEVLKDCYEWDEGAKVS